jgi:hypothetical protein
MIRPPKGYRNEGKSVMVLDSLDVGPDARLASRKCSAPPFGKIELQRTPKRREITPRRRGPRIYCAHSTLPVPDDVAPICRLPYCFVGTCDPQHRYGRHRLWLHSPPRRPKDCQSFWHADALSGHRFGAIAAGQNPRPVTQHDQPAWQLSNAAPVEPAPSPPAR